MPHEAEHHGLVIDLSVCGEEAPLLKMKPAPMSDAEDSDSASAAKRVRLDSAPASDDGVVTTCPVCTYSSGERLCCHYGAVCCFSCRAFFRRAHKDTKDPPNFMCRKQGKCHINVVTRKKCQKCRYDRCLHLGMDPDLVLNEEQKRIRFRVMLSKKEAKQSPGPDIAMMQLQQQQIGKPVVMTSLVGGAARPLASLQQRPVVFWGMPQVAAATTTKRRHVILRRHEDAVEEYPRSLSSSPASSTSSGASGQRFFTASPDLGLEPVQSRKRKAFDALSFLASADSLAFSPTAATKMPGPAHAAYSYAAAMNEMTAPAKFVEHLYAFQYGKPRLSRQELCAHILRLSTAFEQFSRSLSSLQSLPTDVQTDLIAHNAPLFVSYLLARYFASSTGQEQVQWLLQTTAKSSEDVSGLHRKVGVRQFNCRLQFLTDSNACEVFEAGAVNIAGTGIPMHLTALVANAILFHGGHRSLQSSSSFIAVQAKFIESVDVLRSAMGAFSPSLETVLQMFTELSSLKDCLEAGLATDSEVPQRLPFLNLPLPYTLEEESWLLEREVSWFQDAWESAPAAKDTITQLADIVRGYCPLAPRAFLPSLVRALLEKTRAMTRLQSDFKALSIATQNESWCRNCLPAIAACLIKLESTASGAEQLSFLLGHFGWDGGDGMAVAPLRFGLASADGDARRLRPEDAADWAELARTLAPVVKSEAAFKLFAAVVLFDDSGVRDEMLSAVRKRFVGLLVRRLQFEQQRIGGARVKPFDEEAVRVAVAAVVKMSALITKVER